MVALLPSILLAQSGHIKSVVNSNERSVIAIEGLEKPFTIAHLTDSHITLLGEEDAPYKEYWSRMGGAYEHTKSYRGGELSRTDAFKQTLGDAVYHNVDLVLLGGDILNFPSPECVRFLQEELAVAALPYLFISGNHDWHMEGMKGSADKLRDEWINKVLLPLYQGNNPYYHALQMGGVNIVVIDNSTYQVSQEQLDFYNEQVSKGLPIVLLVHIPITMIDGDYGTGDPLWGYDSDNGYYTERRERWPKSGNSPSTVAFAKAVKQTPSVVVLAGHTHANSFDFEGGMVQLVSKYSRDGSYRSIELIPYR